MKTHCDLLTTGQAARICGVASRTIATWVDEGRIPGAYLVPNTKHRRIPREALRSFIAQHNMTARLPDLELTYLNALIVSPNIWLYESVGQYDVGCSLYHANNLLDVGIRLVTRTPSVVVVDDNIGTIEATLLCAKAKARVPLTKIVVVSEINAKRYEPLADVVLDTPDPQAIAGYIKSHIVKGAA